MTPAFLLQGNGLSWGPSWLALAALTLLLLTLVPTLLRARRRLAGASALRRWTVTLLNVLGVIAIGLLLAPPVFERLADDRTTLLTEGVDVADEPAPQRDAEPVPASVPSPGAISTADQFVLGASNPGAAQRLRTAGQLTLRRPGLDRLTVLGHGLDADQWATLPTDLQLDFRPLPLAGPVRVHWPALLGPGDALVVTGELRLPRAEQVAELRLVDPSGVTVASTSARSGQAFSLAATPRATGAATYRLETGRGTETYTDDPVSVYVRAARGARLLVVQSAPSFETRQLGNWAVDSGNALVVHSQVSRDRDLVQGFNLPADASLDIAAGLLAETDLVMIDGRRWAAMPEGERERYLAAVRDGLGLVLLADRELAAWLEAEAAQNLVGTTLQRRAEPDPVFPRWADVVPDRPLPLAPYDLSVTTARSLTRDEEGRLLESWQPLGRGRIAVSLLRERHRWATSGELSIFGRYWARLLRDVGRDDERPRWLAPEHRPRPGTRFALCSSPGDGLRMRLAAADGGAWSEATPLVSHGSGAPRHCAHAWPATAGWLRAQLLGPDPEATVLDEILLRVYGDETWRIDTRERRQTATLQRTAVGLDSGERLDRRPLSPWWAWSLLLLAGGALWLERRLHDLG